MLERSLVFIALLLVCWLCYLQDAEASSYTPAHPQEKFCRAKYVFRFIPMGELNNTSEGRSKRYVRHYRTPMKVEVKQIYKGAEMAMSMMEISAAENDTNDVFSEDDTRIEAAMLPTDTTLEKNHAYIYFGRIKFRKNKRNGGRRIIYANLDNTIAENDLTKVMRRGIRKKYRKACEAGCRVKTVFRKMEADGDENYCFYQYGANNTPQEKDCTVKTQFCRKGKDGLCHWYKTKSYYQCKCANGLAKNPLSKKTRKACGEYKKRTS